MARVSFSDVIKYLPVVDEFVQIVHNTNNGTGKQSIVEGLNGVIGLAVPFIKAANPQYAAAIDILLAEISKVLADFNAEVAPASASASNG